LIKIITSDKRIITDIKLDSQNNIDQALVIYPQGEIALIEDGKLINNSQSQPINLNYNCALSSLYELLSLLDIETSQEELLYYLSLFENSPPLSGNETSLLSLQKTLQELELNYKSVRLTYNELETITSPVILHLNLENDQDHYVVLLKIDEDGVAIIDNGEEKVLCKEEILSLWSGYALVEYRFQKGEILGEEEAERIKGAESIDFGSLSDALTLSAASSGSSGFGDSAGEGSSEFNQTASNVQKMFSGEVIPVKSVSVVCVPDRPSLNSVSQVDRDKGIVIIASNVSFEDSDDLLGSYELNQDHITTYSGNSEGVIWGTSNVKVADVHNIDTVMPVLDDSSKNFVQWRNEEGVTFFGANVVLTGSSLSEAKYKLNQDNIQASALNNQGLVAITTNVSVSNLYDITTASYSLDNPSRNMLRFINGGDIWEATNVEYSQGASLKDAPLDLDLEYVKVYNIDNKGVIRSTTNIITPESNKNDLSKYTYSLENRSKNFVIYVDGEGVKWVAGDVEFKGDTLSGDYRLHNIPGMSEEELEGMSLVDVVDNFKDLVNPEVEGQTVNFDDEDYEIPAGKYDVSVNLNQGRATYSKDGIPVFQTTLVETKDGKFHLNPGDVIKVYVPVSESEIGSLLGVEGNSDLKNALSDAAYAGINYKGNEEIYDENFNVLASVDHTNHRLITYQDGQPWRAYALEGYKGNRIDENGNDTGEPAKPGDLVEGMFPATPEDVIRELWSNPDKIDEEVREALSNTAYVWRSSRGIEKVYDEKFNVISVARSAGTEQLNIQWEINWIDGKAYFVGDKDEGRILKEDGSQIGTYKDGKVYIGSKEFPYAYNDKGDITDYTEVFPDGSTITHHIEYEYDSEGRIIKSVDRRVLAEVQSPLLHELSDGKPHEVTFEIKVLRCDGVSIGSISGWKATAQYPSKARFAVVVNGEVVKEFEQDWGTTETFKFKLTLSKGDKVEIVDLTPVTYTATTDRGYEMKEYDNNIIIEDLKINGIGYGDGEGKYYLKQTPDEWGLEKRVHPTKGKYTAGGDPYAYYIELSDTGEWRCELYALWKEDKVTITYVTTENDFDEQGNLVHSFQTIEELSPLRDKFRDGELHQVNLEITVSPTLDDWGFYVPEGGLAIEIIDKNGNRRRVKEITISNRGNQIYIIPVELREGERIELIDTGVEIREDDFCDGYEVIHSVDFDSIKIKVDGEEYDFINRSDSKGYWAWERSELEGAYFGGEIYLWDEDEKKITTIETSYEYPQKGVVKYTQHTTFPYGSTREEEGTLIYNEEGKPVHSKIIRKDIITPKARYKELLNSYEDGRKPDWLSEEYWREAKTEVLAKSKYYKVEMPDENTEITTTIEENWEYEGDSVYYTKKTIESGKEVILIPEDCLCGCYGFYWVTQDLPDTVTTEEQTYTQEITPEGNKKVVQTITLNQKEVFDVQFEDGKPHPVHLEIEAGQIYSQRYSSKSPDEMPSGSFKMIIIRGDGTEEEIGEWEVKDKRTIELDIELSKGDKIKFVDTTPEDNRFFIAEPYGDITYYYDNLNTVTINSVKFNGKDIGGGWLSDIGTGTSWYHNEVRHPEEEVLILNPWHKYNKETTYKVVEESVFNKDNQPLSYTKIEKSSGTNYHLGDNFYSFDNEFSDDLIKTTHIDYEYKEGKLVNVHFNIKEETPFHQLFSDGERHKVKIEIKAGIEKGEWLSLIINGEEVERWDYENAIVNSIEPIIDKADINRPYRPSISAIFTTEVEIAPGDKVEIETSRSVGVFSVKIGGEVVSFPRRGELFQLFPFEDDRAYETNVDRSIEYEGEKIVKVTDTIIDSRAPDLVTTKVVDGIEYNEENLPVHSVTTINQKSLFNQMFPEEGEKQVTVSVRIKNEGREGKWGIKVIDAETGEERWIEKWDMSGEAGWKEYSFDASLGKNDRLQIHMLEGPEEGGSQIDWIAIDGKRYELKQGKESNGWSGYWYLDQDKCAGWWEPSIWLDSTTTVTEDISWTDFGKPKEINQSVVSDASPNLTTDFQIVPHYNELYYLDRLEETRHFYGEESQGHYVDGGLASLRVDYSVFSCQGILPENNLNPLFNSAVVMKPSELSEIPNIPQSSKHYEYMYPHYRSQPEIIVDSLGRIQMSHGYGGYGGPLSWLAEYTESYTYDHLNRITGLLRAEGEYCRYDARIADGEQGVAMNKQWFSLYNIEYNLLGLRKKEMVDTYGYMDNSDGARVWYRIIGENKHTYNDRGELIDTAYEEISRYEKIRTYGFWNSTFGKILKPVVTIALSFVPGVGPMLAATWYLITTAEQKGELTAMDVFTATIIAAAPYGAKVVGKVIGSQLARAGGWLCDNLIPGIEATSKIVTVGGTTITAAHVAGLALGAGAIAATAGIVEATKGNGPEHEEVKGAASGDGTYNCAVVSLHKLFKAEGIDITKEEIAQAIYEIEGVYPYEGVYTSIGTLEAVAQSYGLNYKVRKVSSQQLREINSPAIIHIDLGGGHFEFYNGGNVDNFTGYALINADLIRA